MSDRIRGERVCSRSPGCYYRVPGTIRRETITIDGEPGYIVALDNGQTAVMTDDMLDTPTDDDVATFQAKQERDAAYEAERLAKLERKRQRREEREAIMAQRRQDERDEKQAAIDAERLARQNELRKQNARVFGLDSLKR